MLSCEALVSHNLAASQLIAPIMGRCLFAVKQLLAKAVIKVQSGNINGCHVPAFHGTAVNSRCEAILSSVHALPQCADPHFLRLNTAQAIDFSKISKAPSLSFWNPWSIKTPEQEQLWSGLSQTLTWWNNTYEGFMAYGTIAWAHTTLGPWKRKSGKQGEKKEAESEHCHGHHRRYICITQTSIN